MVPGPFAHHSFLHRITTCGVIISRYLFHEVEKIINYFRKTLYCEGLTGFWICLGFWKCQRSEFTKVMNITRFWICFWLWTCQSSGYTTALNMPGLHRVLNIPEYVWIIPGYAWMCLNQLSKAVCFRYDVGKSWY